MRYRIAPPCHRYFIHYQRLLTTQNDERVQAAIPIVIMACVDCVACERVYTRTEYKTLHTHSHTSCIARAPDASSTAFSPTRRNELIYTNGDFCQLANYHLSTTNTQHHMWATRRFFFKRNSFGGNKHFTISQLAEKIFTLHSWSHKCINVWNRITAKQRL